MGMTDEQAMDLMTKDAFQTQAEAEGKLVARKAQLHAVAHLLCRHFVSGSRSAKNIRPQRERISTC